MLGLNRVEKYSLNMGAGQVGAIAFGKGDKPLVLIPGLSLQGVREAGASLAIAYRIFAKDYRVWVFDRKTPADKSCTIQSLADDLALAMATMGDSVAGRSAACRDGGPLAAICRSGGLAGAGGGYVCPDVFPGLPEKA